MTHGLGSFYSTPKSSLSCMYPTCPTRHKIHSRCCHLRFCISSIFKRRLNIDEPLTFFLLYSLAFLWLLKSSVRTVIVQDFSPPRKIFIWMTWTLLHCQHRIVILSLIILNLRKPAFTVAVFSKILTINSPSISYIIIEAFGSSWFCFAC